MKKKIVFNFLIVILFSVVPTLQLGAQQNYYSKKLRTYCNPVNISYRFCLDKPSRREAADPTVILFKDEYYMFASKSGGYWCSTNLLEWDLIETKDLPVEEYAPTAVVINDTVFFMASGEKNPIFKTADPKSGKWSIANPGLEYSMTDPALFYDNGRLYLYCGCSNKEPLYAVELDLKNHLQPIGDKKALFGSDVERHGWERPGELNDSKNNPWFEGAWMNKHNEKYYLQYAAPGTEFKGYADGVYVSDKPIGPFEYQKSNPFSLKQGGFICGAGHGSTFEDKYGNYWHIATQTISVKHMFERRLGIFPAGFDKDGTLYSQTAWGDYPHYIFEKKTNHLKNSFTGWMLLSYKKHANASSSIDSLPVKNSFDEDIRTYWSAKTGNEGEWLKVDLGGKCRINAIQINFAEHGTNIFGRQPGIYYQYTIEYSNDGLTWHLLIDKSKNETDMPHDYVELGNPVIARYLKLNCIHIPSGKFAVSDFRVFGKGNKNKPKEVNGLRINRDLSDDRNAVIEWNKDQNAMGYLINYGIDKNKLYNHLMVYDNNFAEMKNLNVGTDYYLSIDSFNECGITEGKKIKEAKSKN
jgi:xylan 1,4-beta-xylosidase